MMRSLIIFVTLLSLAACTKKNQPTTAELKIGITQEFENLNPLIMSMSATTYMYHMTNRTLNMLDPEGNWIPKLAKEIPTLENGKAKIITVNGQKKIVAEWEILGNASWGDGTPVTCADFAFARDIATSNMVAVGEKEVFAQVEKITWDPKTPKKCTFHHEKAKWNFNKLSQFYALPKHIEGPVWEQYGQQKEGYEKNSNYVRNPTNPGLFNGPYVITEVKLGDHVTFEPNKFFYGEKPKIQKIIVKLIPSTGTLEANLRSGTIDMVSTLGFTLDQALAFEKKVKADNLPFNVMYVQSLVYEHIDFNLDNPILKDIRVRKAMIHAINREDLVKALFEGKQAVAHHNMSPKDPWFTMDPNYVTVYDYSKEKAQKLLDDAGWKTLDSSGYRTKDGKRLSFVFITTAGNKVRELVQAYLQEQWKQVGVEVVIKNEPAKVFFGETASKRKFTGMIMYAWVSSPENNPRSTLHSKSVPNDKNAFAGQNYSGWSNATVDKTIEAIDLEFDAEKRKKLAWELQKQYTNDVPVIPLYYRVDISVPPSSLKNYRMPGHLYHETTEVERWSF